MRGIQGTQPEQGTQPAGSRAPGAPAGERQTRYPRNGQLLGWARVVLVLAVVVGLDQLSKRAVRGSIAEGEERKLLPGVELVHTRNRGVAFGLLPGSHVLVTVLIGLALAALVAYFARHSAQRLLWLPTGMLLGGALGNVIDRLDEGSVTDFVKLPLGWPPFNLADTSIVVGAALLALVVDHQRHAGR
jgi:signal peptidase II